MLNLFGTEEKEGLEMKLVIRRMKPEDAADIQALNTQLGYSYPADKIAARINFSALFQQ